MAKEVKLPEPFRPVVCQRLRSLVKIRNDAIVGKQAATKNRDQLEKEINACSDGENDKKEELKAAWFDEVHSIKQNHDTINAAHEQIIAAIEGGDQLELIDTIEPNPTVADLFDQEEEVDQDTIDPDKRDIKDLQPA